MELLIVTGMSGSGKSKALNNLEDNGFYCLDNLPLKLLPNVIDTVVQMEEFSQKMAVTADVRNFDISYEFDRIIEIISKKVEVHILFLDCEDTVLLKRYKESRRLHPLMTWDNNMDLSTAIDAERHLLEKLRQEADYVIDTSVLSVSELRSKLLEVLSASEQEGMQLNFVAFGYRYGIPTDSDIVFDVRCLPNPYYIESLRNLTGENEQVQDYVMSFEESRKLYESIVTYLECAIPMYIKEGKAQLVVAIGCTGGQHRSLTFALLLSEHFSKCGYRTHINSRDKEKNKYDIWERNNA